MERREEDGGAKESEVAEDSALVMEVLEVVVVVVPEEGESVDVLSTAVEGVGLEVDVPRELVYSSHDCTTAASVGGVLLSKFEERTSKQ